MPRKLSHEKISESNRGRKHFPESREKMSRSLHGKPVTAETRQKLALGSAQPKWDDEIDRARARRMQMTTTPEIRAERRRRAKELHAQGMSMEMIGVELGGWSATTISHDLNRPPHDMRS